MIWVSPAAAIALLAAAAPILIHVLVQRHAPRVPFPTLRFIRPVHIAAVRRRSLEDGLLLAVRVLIVAAAVAAVAGPFLETAARRRSWDARTIRAVVSDGAQGFSRASGVPDGDDVKEGLRRAVAWLETQPPARREIVVRSAFPLGAIDASDIAAVPAHIGLRFERSGSLPAGADVAAPPALRLADRKTAPHEIERRVVLEDDRTRVREIESSKTALVPVEIVAPAAQQTLAQAVLDDVLADGIVAPPSGRAARIMLSAQPARSTDSRSSAAPWMADAAARIARDAAENAARGHAPPDVRFSLGDRLVVSTSAEARDPFVRTLIRSVAAALAPEPWQTGAEILPIAEAQLRAWSRPPGSAPAPQRHSIDRDDRRWLWLLILALLALEAWLRRPRPTAAMPVEGAAAEEARVA